MTQNWFVREDGVSELDHAPGRSRGHRADAGLSMAGLARLVEDRGEAVRILDRLTLKYPDSPPLPFPMPTPEKVHIFCVAPGAVSVLDYGKGFGHTVMV
jgi:hypothetical protein